MGSRWIEKTLRKEAEECEARRGWEEEERRHEEEARKEEAE
jgi:hypothetical protein